MNNSRRATFNPAQMLLCCGVMLFCWFWGITPASADVKLPSVLSDNMVLQQDHVLYFWGLSDPEEIVTVIIGDKRYAATADAKGAWWVKMPAMHRPQPFSITVKGKNTITLNNCITGDVWMCAGQSNMYAPVKDVEHAPEDIEGANYPDIRIFKQEANCAGDPEFDGGGKWEICSPETIKEFSAIGYFFGRELNDRTKNTLGLIQAARPGSSIETWLSREAIEKTPYKGLLGENEENFKQYELLQSEIKTAEEADNQKDLTRLKKQARSFNKKVNTATCAYNALVAPIAPFQMKGVIWYQGENDIGENLKFRRLFTGMIQDWREQFRSSTLPFYFVQLPPIGIKKDIPEDSYYAELREAQAEVQKSPYTYMVVSIDTIKGNDIPMHPREKKNVAHRLANLVLATQYKEPIKIFGPSFEAIDIEDSAIRVHIRRAEPQLMARGGTPQGFEIAGDDKMFKKAEARIDGDSIVVFNKKVKKPVAVRYSWADNPVGNVFTADEIPLIPFRSDEWSHRKPEQTAPATASSGPSTPKPKETGGTWTSFGGSSNSSQQPTTQAPPPQPRPQGKGGAPFAWPTNNQ